MQSAATSGSSPTSSIHYSYGDRNSVDVDDGHKACYRCAYREEGENCYEGEVHHTFVCCVCDTYHGGIDSVSESMEAHWSDDDDSDDTSTHAPTLPSTRSSIDSSSPLTRPPVTPLDDESESGSS